ncbi:hypothetical protein HQ520_11200 [bacterium]|nr:hypothetical protein [bacterium]
MKSRLESQEKDLRRLRQELGRRQELLTQTGATGGLGEADPRSRLSTYEKGQETPSERFDREFRKLENRFSEGRLTQEEFEKARQHLKTMV